MFKPKILVILGSIREGRNGLKVAEWFMGIAKQFEGEAEIELIDLKNYPLPMFADAVPSSMRQGPHENADVQQWLDLINSGDGYVIITPEYNHSFSSVLKNALDYPYQEWADKMIGFVGYGGMAGGARAVEHLRQVAGELHMYDVRDQVTIPAVWAAFDDKGKLNNHELHEKNAKLMLGKIIELTKKIRG